MRLLTKIPQIKTALITLTLLAVGGCVEGTTIEDLDVPTDDVIETSTDLEIGGLWSDNYGGWTSIDNASWGTKSILEYNNTENWAVTQNAENDEWSPNLFSFVVWTDATEDGQWFHCTVAYDLDSLADALAVEDSSDATDPENGGCGDFAWTAMSPREPIELVGVWSDNYGGETDISTLMWGAAHLREYDNQENWAVTQNPADDEWGPNQFNYVVWTEPSADTEWWFCTVAYGMDDLSSALATEDTSDDANPSEAGCGDFAWTQMSVAE